jgi:hypothetical protein
MHETGLGAVDLQSNLRRPNPLQLENRPLDPLMKIVSMGWVVGPRYDPKTPKRLIGLRAVKGWYVINLDDAAEEAVTVRSDSPEELLRKVEEYEAGEEQKLAEA